MIALIVIEGIFGLILGYILHHNAHWENWPMFFGFVASAAYSVAQHASLTWFVMLFKIVFWVGLLLKALSIYRNIRKKEQVNV